MKPPYLSVIIPAYNEAGRLPDTLRDIHAYLEKKPWLFEIVVVNDGSTDATAGMVREIMKKAKHVILIDNARNAGKGFAVRQGMLRAQGEIRLFMDADNATSIREFEKFIPYFNAGFDVVIGSRGMKESEVDPPAPFIRRVSGKFGNILIQELLLPGMRDTQCGFKAFLGSLADEIFRLGKINGWGFDVEALALARERGSRIKEIGVRWSNRNESKVRMSSYLQTLREILTIRWRLWNGSYRRGWRGDMQ